MTGMATKRSYDRIEQRVLEFLHENEKRNARKARALSRPIRSCRNGWWRRYSFASDRFPPSSRADLRFRTSAENYLSLGAATRPDRQWCAQDSDTIAWQFRSRSAVETASPKRLEIAARNFPAGKIQLRPKSAERIGQMKTNFARQKRNDLRRDERPRTIRSGDETFSNENARRNSNQLRTSRESLDNLSFQFRHVCVESLLKPRTDFRVERIRLGRAGELVAPMFVHPNPGRRILPNEWFDLVPAGLGDLDNGCALFKFKPWIKVNAIPSAGQRLAINRHDRRTGALMQPGMRVGHAFFHSETIDRHTRVPRFERKIGQDGDMLATLQRFVHANDSALARSELVTGMRAQLREDRIEQRILEFLSQRHSAKSAQAQDQRAPFEISVVEGGKDDPAPRTNVGENFIETDNFHPFAEVRLRHAGGPKQIEHRARQTAGKTRARHGRGGAERVRFRERPRDYSQQCGGHGDRASPRKRP